MKEDKQQPWLPQFNSRFNWYVQIGGDFTAYLQADCLA